MLLEQPCTALDVCKLAERQLDNPESIPLFNYQNTTIPQSSCLHQVGGTSRVRAHKL